MTASYRPLFAVVCVLCVVSADAIMQAEEKGRKMSPPGLDCEKARFNMDCLKLDLVSFLETMSDTKEYRIGGGLSIVQDASVNRTKNADIVADLARSFPNDAESRLNGFVLAKITNFLQSHTLNVQLLDSADVEKARSAMEDGRKHKKKGGLEGIIAAALMMKSMLMALAMGALALLAGKALIAALMALMLAALNSFKALTSGKQSTTYEIITKPSHSGSYTHSSQHEGGHDHSGGGIGSSGYGRSMSFELPEHLQKNMY